MGISIQEFLSGRVACPVCDASGDQEHCITALLSREDSCILFNSMFHNQNARTDSDTKLLQEIRATTDPKVVLDYYIRSEQVTQRINAREDRVDVWNRVYKTYIPNMLVKVRAGKKEDAVKTIDGMLREIEKKY
jgi:hypothetical protein